MARSAARPPLPLACVLLAAGGSQRLGTPKQLVRYRARPLLLHAIRAARAAAPDAPLVVVLGAHAVRLRPMLRRVRCDAVVVTNPRWADGMAGSLRVGLRATPRGTRAALLLLVDQPLVNAGALKRLLRAWRRKPGTPAAAHYDGRPGVPAILPRRYWRAIGAQRGDSGARSLLRGAPAVTRVDMPEAAVDVDTPADLSRLR